MTVGEAVGRGQRFRSISVFRPFERKSIHARTLFRKPSLSRESQGEDKPNAVGENEQNHRTNVRVEVGVDSVLLVVALHLRNVHTVQLL